MSEDGFHRIHVVDSHTGGEPTRVVVSGGPSLGIGSLSERLERLKAENDHFRAAVVTEPRGSDALVGALLCSPVEPDSAAGVIFFNNVGYLGMCGHGTIGLVVTLAYLKRIRAGNHRIETPVGTVSARLHASGEVTLTNVPSYRFAARVPVPVPGLGEVVGDIAWGGNWFFLVDNPPIELRWENLDALIEYTWSIRKALTRHGIVGAHGEEIDHIELTGPPSRPGVDSRNFVLCPGKSYDRSPCGTGTSAKMACQYEEGKLKAGQLWRQESIVGSVFEGTLQVHEGLLVPSIKGSAFVTGESDLLIDPEDPFGQGIPR